MVLVAGEALHEVLMAVAACVRADDEAMEYVEGSIEVVMVVPPPSPAPSRWRCQS